MRVRICVFFEEAIPNGLPVKDWHVRWSSVKIGEGRMAVLHDESMNVLEQEEYYLPN